MKKFQLGKSGVDVSGVILGLMRINTLQDDQIRLLYEAARQSGINVFDHADIYGGKPHHCEARFGGAVSLSAAEREEIIVQSKVGIRSGFFDFSKEHIFAGVDRSLAALKTEYLDVLLLHRPDALVEPDEVAVAFETLYESGKVRHFGVSNHTPGQIQL